MGGPACVAAPRRAAGLGPRSPPGGQELDRVDAVEGPVIRGGPRIEVLNGVSLHGGPADSRPREASITARLVVEIRRTDASGVVELLNRRFEWDSRWPNRPVRAEVDLDGVGVRFYRPRRREPADRPLLRRATCGLPGRRFQD